MSRICIRTEWRFTFLYKGNITGGRSCRSWPWLIYFLTNSKHHPSAPAVSKCVPTCPDGGHQYLGSCYWVDPSHSYSGSEARSACLARDMQLVTIRSKQENDYINGGRCFIVWSVAWLKLYHLYEGGLQERLQRITFVSSETTKSEALIRGGFRIIPSHLILRVGNMAAMMCIPQRQNSYIGEPGSRS